MKAAHEIFAEQVATGKPQTEAYLIAFPTSSRPAARANASRLIAKDSIREKIVQFRQEARKEELLTWEEKRRYLATLVNDPETPPWIVLQAIKLDNKMAGHDRPPEENKVSDFKRIMDNLKPTLAAC